MDNSNVTPLHPKEQNKKEEASLVSSLSPREIVSELDRFVVGQNKAKKAVAVALRQYPMMNISVSDDKIILKKKINIGMATALADGNLIVPVIKNADQLNLVGIAKSVNDLASRARSNNLMPNDVAGGTYTVTNVGVFGSIMGTPIINQPQVGILAFGAIRKMPSVIETEEGDYIGIRKKMIISHSYDHRVVNGALGSKFIKAVKDYLENWNSNREI